MTEQALSDILRRGGAIRASRTGLSEQSKEKKAWVAKLMIERSPAVMMGILHIPGMTRVVAERMGNVDSGHGPVTRRVARRVGRRARRALGRHAA